MIARRVCAAGALGDVTNTFIERCDTCVRSVRTRDPNHRTKSRSETPLSSKATRDRIAILPAITSRRATTDGSNVMERDATWSTSQDAEPDRQASSPSDRRPKVNRAFENSLPNISGTSCEGATNACTFARWRSYRHQASASARALRNHSHCSSAVAKSSTLLGVKACSGLVIAQEE